MKREYVVRELEREWAQIESDKKKLELEKTKVVAEWVDVEDAQRAFDKKRDAFEKLVRKRFDFLPQDAVVAFNVGGQLFKSTVSVWTRDRFSILAQLCTTAPKLPKLCVDDDAYFFDRDTWIFQFIYVFLRDNTLPDDLDTLRELYCEASFYRIGLLRHAIESKMIGDDAMAANVLASTSAAMRSAPSAAAVTPLASSTSRSSVDPQASSTPRSAAAVSHTKNQHSGCSTSTTTSTPSSEVKEASSKNSSTPSNKYSELPDPFGFTSKKSSTTS